MCLPVQGLQQSGKLVDGWESGAKVNVEFRSGGNGDGGTEDGYVWFYEVKMDMIGPRADGKMEKT